MKKAAICILGCRVNQSEGESFLEYFKNNDYQIVDFKEKADVYLIHTCTVTSQADSKSRQMIRKAKKTNNEAKVVVTGCYAQTEPGVLQNMPEVDLIIGMKDRDNIIKLLEENETEKVHIFDIRKIKDFENMITSNTDKTRAFIKIQEGCESFCSYCIIPIARGRIRSRAISDIIEEIAVLEEQGYQEIVLTGIHAGAYGLDLGLELSQLMAEITAKTTIPRVRFGSLDPNEINESFLKEFSNQRFMPHIHLALQSGDDEILKIMNRKYDCEQYLATIEKLRLVKGELLSITTDIMVGFPYEKEEHHKRSMEFIRRCQLDNLHIFQYSKRKGTRAAKFPEQVESEIKKIRAREMEELKKELHLEFQKKMLGQNLSVLIEKANKNEAIGYSDNYLKVIIENKTGKILENNIYSVKIIEIQKNMLIGELV